MAAKSEERRFGCDHCDDEDPTAFPGAPDPYGDWTDQDCDGTDGIGTPVSGAVAEGAETYSVSGWWLAAGDLDGDGCDDLLIGEPGYWGWPDAPHQVRVGRRCLPFPAFDVMSRDGVGSDLWGSRVEAALSTVMVLDAGSRTAVSLFAGADFGADAVPLLEVRGGGTFTIDDATLLGTDWLLMGRGASLDHPSASTARTGLVDFAIDAPDHKLTTGGAGGRVADIGDRDATAGLTSASPSPRGG